MSNSEDSITLQPPQHEKLGILHCGVTRPGFVGVAGETRDLADGESYQFQHVGISVKRAGNDYTFTRTS